MMHEELRQDLLKGRRIYKVLIYRSSVIRQTYKTVTLSKPRQAVINDLVEMFEHELVFTISENGQEVYRKEESPLKPVKEVLTGEYSNKSFN